MSYNWQEHWKSNDHPFHLSNANPLLEEYWQRLQLPIHSHVLVPLCGKTADLLWLAQQGHQVIGIEISPIACEAFFTENNLTFEYGQQGDMAYYKNNKITIYCCDFFKLTPTILPDITAVYDRAALIALPPKIRQSYVKQLNAITIKNADMLLIVMDTKDLTHEHPYPLHTEDIEALFRDDFMVNELARTKIKNLSSFLISRGYQEAYEVVYQLKKMS